MDRYIDRLTDITNRTKWYIMIHMLWICECSNFGSSPWCLRRVSQINFECLSTACSFNRGWDLLRMSPSSQLEYVWTYPTWGHRAKELKEPTRHAVTLCYSQFNRPKRATDHRVTFSGAGWIPINIATTKIRSRDVGLWHEITEITFCVFQCRNDERRPKTDRSPLSKIFPGGSPHWLVTG